MFGKILKFDDNRIILENLAKVADANYIGFHIVFDEPNHKIIGEIVSVDSSTITILLVGEINDGKFSNGVLKKPGINSKARIIFKSELELILGSQNFLDKSNLLFGTSSIYKDYSITCKMNDFFSNHFAIIGNTGSGKSCGITRLIQNIFFQTAEGIPKNAHLCLFDVYGEYYNVFEDINKIDGLHFKKITTQIEFGDTGLLIIPPYLLDVDDLAILLGANDPSQLHVLRKTLELVKIFSSDNPSITDYKNDIIAKAILEILSSGKNATQVRDQIISVLSSYNTETLNLNTEVTIPGYKRTLRQCLNIDEQGKINAINLIVDFLQKFVKVEIEQNTVVFNDPYTLNDIYYALEFALISEGSLNSEAIYDRNNVLKSRLSNIINSDLANFFKCDKVYSKGEYVQEFFTNEFGDPCQLVDVNLSFLDDSFAKSITKIFSRLFFEFTTMLDKRGSFPIHILLEEAHRYVQNDRDIDLLGYNIFDRITKEGRKYGTILGFITQRPCELSKTALSQCSNFIVFRLFYPEDLSIVKGISSNVTDETIEKIKTLHTGMGLVFGNAFKIPLLVNFPLPNPLPISTSLKIDDVWYN